MLRSATALLGLLCVCTMGVCTMGVCTTGACSTAPEPVELRAAPEAVPAAAGAVATTSAGGDEARPAGARLAKKAPAETRAEGTPPAKAPPATPPSTSFSVVDAVPPATGPAPPGGFGAAAERCLASPPCSMERYASLILAAVDAAEARLPCLHLVEGAGVAVDLHRARRCLESAVAREGACGGSSPSLDRLELAWLTGTGRGGERDEAEAQRLLDGCFDDMSYQAVLAAVSSEEPDESPSVCDAGLAQTTVHMVACSWLQRDLLAVRAKALDKAIAARWGLGTVARHRSVSAMHASYVEDMAAAGGERYSGGSMRPLVELAAQSAMIRCRIERWERLVRSTASSAGGTSPSEARDALLAKRRAALESPPPATMVKTWTAPAWRARIMDDERAYAPYRAHEHELLASLGVHHEDAALDAERTTDLSLLETD